MEELFSNNLFAIYIIACIAVISYANFDENQRMYLLYLFTYAIALFKVFRILTSIILLLIITFIFLEYLSGDSKKLTLITNIFYKICDYIFMMFFQYHFFWILIAFSLLYFSRYNYTFPVLQNLLQIASIFSLFWGAHLAISQPFKIKTITEIYHIFDKYPPYQFEYRKEMQVKFDLLCAIEDKTYFQRKDSYSCVSVEYIKCYRKNNGLSVLGLIKKMLSTAFTSKKLHNKKFCLLMRGYSTPEMQLLRTIGVVRGYEKYKFQRKVFEILYSKIFFASLKEYHKANTYLSLDHYRQYLLSVYFQTVLTKIHGSYCRPFSSAFEDKLDICSWSLDGFFVACLGLSFREVSNNNLEVFDDIIKKFGLSPSHIKEIYLHYPSKKLPLDEK